MSVASTPRPLKERIARARLEAALTQQELAREAGCSVFSIGKYERGERTPRGPVLRRIAAATGKPLEWFFVVEAAA